MAIALLLLTAMLAGPLERAPWSWQWQTGSDASRQIKLVEARSGFTFYPVPVRNWWGLMNQAGRLTVLPVYEWTDYEFDSVIRTVLDGRTGYIRADGDWYIRPQFTYADRFAEGYAVVGDGERFWHIDRRGQQVGEHRFDAALRFSEGLAAVMTGGRVGYVDPRGRFEIEPMFAEASSFHEAVAMVRLFDADGLPGDYGYIDKRGELLWRDTTGRVQQAAPLYDNMFRVLVDGRWGYLDRRFRLAIEPRFTAARDFHNGFAAVYADGRWGYIDRSGDWAIQPTFDAADDFDETAAMVMVDGKIGYVDKRGRWLLPPVLHEAEPFFRGLARISLPEGVAYMDTSARLVWDPAVAEMGFIDLTNRGQAETQLREKRDLIRKGSTTIPPPQWRPPLPSPYPPEYMYYPVLPQPPR